MRQGQEVTKDRRVGFLFCKERAMTSFLPHCHGNLLIGALSLSLSSIFFMAAAHIDHEPGSFVCRCEFPSSRLEDARISYVLHVRE